MVKRSKGFFSKGTKTVRMKKKITVNEFVKPFEKGETVKIIINSCLNGVPHRRYNGRGGEIMKKQGRSYVIKIKDGKSEKILIVNPVHIRRLNAQSAA